MHTHTHTCVYIHTDTCAHTEMHTHACAHTHPYTCAHIHTHAHLHRHMCTHTHAHVDTSTQTHTYAHTCAHPPMHIDTRVRTHIYTCTYMYTHTDTGPRPPGPPAPEGAAAPTGCGRASRKPPPEQAAQAPQAPRPPMLTEGCAGRGWAVSLGGAFGVRLGGERQPCRFISSSLCSGIFRPFMFLRGHKRAWRWPGRRSIILAPRTSSTFTCGFDHQRQLPGRSGRQRGGQGSQGVRPGVREATASPQPGRPWPCGHRPLGCVASEL
ncbi:hypothetical protein FD755_011642 [Muntiacus reevesi]|uniref:Uncharacterized protein n=1 Tax=Muntiacus reevesi TaxID=9886 RepID=A0A5N3XTH8_MUNRE|nr:hypothetical protein FD755_011642 [Muntiacus reevesi]